MKKAAVIGHFAVGKDMLNGQTIKTKTIAHALGRRLGKEEVLCVDTHGGKKRYPTLVIDIIRAFFISENIIILPAHNGVRVIAPLVGILNRAFKKRLHYIVIGGWLPDLLRKHPNLMSHLNSFQGIYVETNTMRSNLEKLGLSNIKIMPNCKRIEILEQGELIFSSTEPFRLCTFSRVMKEKGIEDAVRVVKMINEKHERIIFTLDIYGQVDSDQTQWFDTLMSTAPRYISYQGTVPYEESVKTIKNYYALLFPTRFYTEGIPGTIIDAYASGVPVISSKWESFSDIIDDYSTGIGYKFNDFDELYKIMLRIKDDCNTLNNMKFNCLDKAKEYDVDNAIDVLQI